MNVKESFGVSQSIGLAPIAINGIALLVDAGFAIHRLHVKSKAPIGKDWSGKPVLSFEELQQRYKPGENVGVRLGKWSKVGGGYLHVIDIDIRDKKLAEAARARLTELFPEWDALPTVISGSGGESRHHYLLCDKPFPSKKLAHSVEKIVDAEGKSHWAWEIELFGTGKQVVIPPSIHPDTGKPYTWEREFDFDDLDLGIGPHIPSERIEAITGATDEQIEPDDDRRAPLGLSDDEIRQLLLDIPADQFCDDRDGWLTVGMALHHETGGSAKGFDFWCEFSKRSDKFDKKDQRRVWRSFKGNQKPVRIATLVSAARDAALDLEFENLDDDLDDTPVADVAMFDDLLGNSTGSLALILFDDLLGDSEPVSKRQVKLNKAKVEHALGHVPLKVARINKKHGVAFIKGKTVILTENSDGTVSYGTVNDLHAFYENDRVATEKATEPVTKAWMRHKARREYPNGVVFSPAKEVPGAYNHWRGFAVEPSEDGSCELILQHARTILCNDEPETFAYLIGWLAHMIQKPGEKPGVAIVLRGLKGTGKDTLGDYVGKLFPTHHIKVANQEHMTGRFNAHQERALMLHLEEGFWAGNKQAEGNLKHLITSETVMIEPKGLNAFQVASVLRLFMSSNEKWVVPATGDERRYFVSDVAGTYSLKHSNPGKRKKYFDAIRHERDNGGLEALLHFLMNYDLSKFDVRDVPNTSALAEQKTAGLRNIDAFWFELLQEGTSRALDLAHGADDDWEAGPISFAKPDFMDAYRIWMRGQLFPGALLSSAAIGKWMKTAIPSISTYRPRIGLRREQVSLWRVPPLAQCRAEFDSYIGSVLLWNED